MSKDELAALFEQLRDALGAENVQRFDAPAERQGAATFATNAKILGTVRPDSARQVSAVARLCQRSAVPFYAISTGRNWGYGSAVPVNDALCIDLGRMNRIVDFNERLGYVRVEPGVTSGQLYAYLQQRGGHYWLDATGAGLACSVIGNTLERGFGHTLYADHAAHTCALEVVLADGSVIETGLGALGPAAARQVYPYGIGPDLSGLFFQSSLGIVTAMTIWLMPAPEKFCAFFFAIDRSDAFPQVVEALRPLNLSKMLSAVHIGNDYRVLPSFTQCPDVVMDGPGALAGAQLDALKRRFGVLDWHGSGSLVGSAAQVRDSKRRLSRALRGKVARLTFVDDRRLMLIRMLRPLFKHLGADRFDRQLDVLLPAYDLLKGVPTDRFVGSAYWRKRRPVPADADPDRDRCGLIWCSVLSEASGEQADAVQQIASQSLLSAGFEPGLTTTFLSERCLDHVISIAYDRDLPGADQAAWRAFEALLGSLMVAGYYPYRLPTIAQNLLAQAQPDYRALLSRIEQAFDPNHLFASGRYTFHGDAPAPTDPAAEK